MRLIVQVLKEEDTVLIPALFIMLRRCIFIGFRTSLNFSVHPYQKNRASIKSIQLWCRKYLTIHNYYYETLRVWANKSLNQCKFEFGTLLLVFLFKMGEAKPHFKLLLIINKCKEKVKPLFSLFQPVSLLLRI